MKSSTRRRVAIAVAITALLAAACGSDDAADDTQAPTSTTGAAAATAAPGTSAAVSTAPAGGDYGDYPEPATTAVAAGGVSLELGDTSLGKVLTSDGMTLYIFTPDEGGTPTCVDACASTWPPVAGERADAGEGVAADITVVERPDGTQQLAYAGWPLYFYAADQAPGDVSGQGVGGIWYVIGADGNPIRS